LSVTDLKMLSSESELDPETTVADLRKEVIDKAAVARGKRSKAVPVGAARKSVRNKGDKATMSAVNKAKLRAAEKNLDKEIDQGNFTALDPFSNEHFIKVARDSSVMFVPSAGTPSEAVELIRAKEKAQAAIAMVAAREAREAEARAVGDLRRRLGPPRTPLGWARVALPAWLRYLSERE
jgi:hypothetical protein